MTPDWTQAPKCAQYFNINNGLWYRRKFFEVQVWRDDSWKFTHTTPLILPHFIERPDDAESSEHQQSAASDRRSARCKMTPEQRIDRNLTRICNAAGVAIGHCTEQQLSAMREEMLAIMKESYIKGSNDHYEAMLGKVRK